MAEDNVKMEVEEGEGSAVSAKDKKRFEVNTSNLLVFAIECELEYLR